MVYPQIKYLVLLLVLNFTIQCTNGFHFTTKREQKIKPESAPEPQNKQQNANPKASNKEPVDKPLSPVALLPPPPDNSLCNGNGKFPHEDNRRYIYCFTSSDKMIYQVTDCPLGLCFNPSVSCCDAESCSGSGEGGAVKPEPAKGNPIPPPKGMIPQPPNANVPQPPKGNTPPAPKGNPSQTPKDIQPQPKTPDAKTKLTKDKPQQNEDLNYKMGKPQSKDKNPLIFIAKQGDLGDGFSITSLESKYYFNSKKKIKSVCQNPVKCTTRGSKANRQDHNSYYVCLPGRSQNSFVARLVKCKKETCFRRGKCGKC